jgi:hypothetical protein
MKEYKITQTDLDYISEKLDRVEEILDTLLSHNMWKKELNEILENIDNVLYDIEHQEE